MYDDLTNLLPTERQRVLSLSYFTRLSVVAVLFVAALTFAAMVLLLPTYVFLTGSGNAKQVRLATIEASFSSAEEASLSARLAALSKNTAVLVALAHAPSATAIIRSLLALPRPGVVLTDFVYTPATEKAAVSSTKSGIKSVTVPGTLAVTGIARTREALRNYQLALQNASFARSAALPVSAYAQDSNIAFTITLSLAP
jgi:hypothetical protein